MHSLIHATSERVLLADGAWGTELLRVPGVLPPLEPLNCTQPNRVRALARDYIEAGARILGANTFGIPAMLARDDDPAAAQQLFERGVTLSFDAADGRALVCPPLGPTGLKRGEARFETHTLEAIFSQPVQHLPSLGVTACAIETMEDPIEAFAAVHAARNHALEVSCCFTFQRSSDGSLHTRSGASPAVAAEAALKAGATAVGANCCAGPVDVLDAITAMHAAFPDALLVARPNAGLPAKQAGRWVCPLAPDDLAAYLPRFIEAGVRVLGGCCGTTPAHIRALAAAIPR